MFGEYFLDIDRRELRCSGALVPLTPQVFDLLLYLLRNRDRVVSKDDLLQAIWGGRIVSESALTTRISAARAAIGDSGEAQQLILTLPRKGFRFIGLVQEAGILESTTHARERPALELSGSPSIVVLPFQNMSDDLEQVCFADGLVEQIKTALSRIKWLFVTSKSSGAPQTKSVDEYQVGREIGVRYLLEGSVRKAGGHMRITAQLIDVASGAHLWADRFDGSLNAILELHEHVATTVADATKRVLECAEFHPSDHLPELAAPRISRHPPANLAERRQLTVLSCKLAEAVALASSLDPEDLGELIAAYHRAVAAIACQFEGFVARQLSEGALIYFGYPHAHEDDAERAIRCALVIADTVSSLERDKDLRTCVGIATSMVVIGDGIDGDGSRETRVVGEAPSLAARLQELAAPNAVLIAESTRRLVGGLFEYRSIEKNAISAPVSAWHVLHPSVVTSRFEALRGSGLSPLVGRDDEIDLLLRRWARAKAGDGQIVLVVGEPGIGKSRISAALEERLRIEPYLCLRYFCSPHHQNSALFPFIDQLGRASGFVRDDPPVAKLEKLEALLARVAPTDDDLALLADLLSLPGSEGRPLPNLSPQRKKERTLEALIRLLAFLAREQPVVMVFEDAHWIDPTSRELLDLVVERVRSLPVLLIVTFRPEFQPPWTGQPQVTELALNRLDRRDRTVLIEQIAGGKTLPDEVTRQIAERTDGVPLFVEELTKSVLESGLLRTKTHRYVLDVALPRFAIPTSLHASLLARLDRLGSVRHVAQIGAAIGREFSYELLRAVSQLSEDDLRAALGRLVASELVFQRGAPPDAVYTFKHVLVQDAAHGSLLRNVRQQLHAQIAEALQAQSPELMENQPELFAQQYAEAGFVENSVAYWEKAALRSTDRSAMAEAGAQLQKGLEQLALLPDTPERRRWELKYWSALGAVLLSVKGQAAPETGHAFARAKELWEQLGSPAEFFQVPYGQSRYHAVRGELDLARRLDEELLDLSRRRDDSAGLVLGHMSSGRTLMYAGKFALSRSHLEAALAHHDPIIHCLLVRQIGNYPQVVSQASLGIVLFQLGFPDRAVARSRAAVAEARRRSHATALAVSLSDCTLLLSLVGDNRALGERANELIAVATEHDFPLWGAQGAIYGGWAKVKNGDVAEGVSLLRSGANAYRATRAEAWTPYYTALLARTCEITGRIEESLTLLDDALQITERTEERWFAAELNRRKGELLLRRGHSEAAEELYRKALSIAQEQQAKLWELRAVVSLVRLRCDQGRPAEARDLLAPIYGWFTEGFDTPDLKEAKALLGPLT